MVVQKFPSATKLEVFLNMSTDNKGQKLANRTNHEIVMDGICQKGIIVLWWIVNNEWVNKIEREELPDCQERVNCPRVFKIHKKGLVVLRKIIESRRRRLNKVSKILG